jgi:hypothetical protein
VFFTDSWIVISQRIMGAEWFIGAETNVCYNALDRHVEAGYGDQVQKIRKHHCSRKGE